MASYIDSLFGIEGKKIIMTGASGGLGAGIAEGLLRSGARVVLIGSSDKVENLSASFQEEGYEAYAVRGDLGKEEEIDRIFHESLSFLDGEVDVLINAAGIQRRHFCEDFPKEDWDEVINVNLTSTFLMCQKAGKKMIEQGRGGKIINFASMLSFFGGYTVPAYAASKGGVAQLTKALSDEWAKLDINVNAVAPGYMDTPMNKNLIRDEKRNAEILARIPAGRWGVSKDMIGTVIFLASAASDYVNGAVIPVDGGYLAR